MFSSLEPLRRRPLPDLAERRRRKENYARIPLPAQPLGECLERAAAFGLSGVNYYAQPRNPPYWQVIPGAIPELWVRPAVGRRLAQAQARLAEAGLRLFLLDAWRPQAVQAYVHDVWFPSELARRRPELSAEERAREVRRYWAPPSRVGAPSPHATGGAIDLTLVWEDGAPLFMGSVFDDVTPLAHLDRFEGLDPATASFSDEEACANRRLLFWVMSEAGFAAHPDEWWHFSYGDQMWAAATGAPAALFDQTEPDGP